MVRKTSIRIFLFLVVLVLFGEVCVYGADDFGLTTRLAFVTSHRDNTVETSGGGVSQAKHLDSHTPRLALFMDFGQNGSRYENIEDILTVDMSDQGFLQLVERAQLKLILKEHEIGLSALVDNNKAIQVGNLVGAEYLLFVKIYHNRASIRLIEVRTGKIVLEEDLNTYEDIFLTSAAIREKVIKALKLKPNITECHTVGIISFINKSGTDRSDKLNLELQKSIRQRLRSETWATLLERQYPTGLLEEVELARMGLTKDNVEKLPPADMVIFGTLQDVSSSYKGNTWDVNIELLVRLQKRTASFTITCHSDHLEETAKRIVEEINNFRRKQIESFSVKQEKELWRRQALYLMPRSCYRIGRYYFDCISEREKRDTIEAIRAWENLLLLDPNNTEANLNLGMCLVSLYRFDLVRAMNSHVQDKMAEEQTMRGSLLVETAMRAALTPHNIRTFAFLVDILLPHRSAEICKFILANQKMFEPYEIKNARMRLASLDNANLIDEIDKAVRNVGRDPSLVLTFFIKLQNNYGDSPDVAINCARKYTDSDSSLVRFCAEWTIAEKLYRCKKDPSALLHFDRAIEAHDGAYTAITKSSAAHYGTIDDIYRYKISACNALDKPNIARETALRGVKYFMDASRFNHAIDWLFFYCVTNVLNDNDAEQGIAICDAYLKAHDRDGEMHQDHYRAAVIETRTKFAAILAGISLPDFTRMTLIKGTEATWVNAPKMVGAGGKIWFSWRPGQSGGTAMVYSPENESVRSLNGLPGTIRSVATIGEKVFFAGIGGLYEVNLAGELIKHYQKASNEIPSNHIVDLCAGAGKLYMSFRESDRYGVAVLDLVSNDVMVLAPTSREATARTEPVYFVYRIWWDAANNQLYANNFFIFPTEQHHSRYCWLLKPEGWERFRLQNAYSIIVVSNEIETLRVRTEGKKMLFEFMGTDEKIRWQFPLPELVGEPAWDPNRIWVPTYLGLYEVDRKTGKAKWLAHQDGTQCLAALRYMGRLYVATNRGLYWCDIL